MRARLMEWLVCPLCYGDLGLVTAHAERPLLADEDVPYGALTCATCRVYYPIWNGVPRMLTFPTAVAAEHAKVAASWMVKRLEGFHLPDGQPPAGEERILRNFSAEWLGYEWTGKSYWNLTPTQMLASKRYELGIAPGDLKDRLVLEVGIGIGGTADALSRADSCDVVGMDLGYAVDQAQRYFGRNPRLHLVQASVFAPPFRAGSFDLVYSHGVLHHTHSTRTAFSRVAPLPKADGGALYVWVYSHAQEKATLLRRALMAIETAARPLVSRMPAPAQTAALLPALPLYMLYQNIYARKQLGNGGGARYGWNEALHAARDRLTPPFAFRHTYPEVVQWFEEHRYTQVRQLADEPLPPGVPESYRLNVGVRGRRVPIAEGARS